MLLSSLTTTQATLIGAAIGALFSLGIGAIALVTRRRDHDRSRRQEATNLMKYWHEKAYAENGWYGQARLLVGILDFDQFHAIEQGHGFLLHPQHRKAISDFMSRFIEGYQVVVNPDIGGIAVSAEQSKFIRREVNRLANMMEIIACAYANNVADRQMIRQEFHSVFFAKQKFALSLYISATNRFPSLKFLEVDMYQQQLEQPKVHKRL